MINKTLVANKTRIKLKIAIYGLFSISYILFCYSTGSILLLLLAVLILFMPIQSCILLYRYLQFDKNTKIIINDNLNQIEYYRSNFYIKFHLDSIISFNFVRRDNKISNYFSIHYYQVTIEEQKHPLIITCVFDKELSKYIKSKIGKRHQTKYANTLFLDKEKYDHQLSIQQTVNQK